MTHSSFSSDLSPSHFPLFDYLKDRLDSYLDPIILSEPITEKVKSIPVEKYKEAIKLIVLGIAMTTLNIYYKKNGWMLMFFNKSF